MGTTLSYALEIEKRVEAGVQFLQTCYLGWFNEIDLGILNLAKWGCCILGQLKFIPPHEVNLVELGFVARTIMLNADEYSLLTREWEKRIKELK